MSHYRTREARKRTNGVTANHRQGRSLGLALPLAGPAILLVIIAAVIVWPRLTTQAGETAGSVTPTNAVPERTVVVNAPADPTGASVAAQGEDRVQPLTPQDGLVKVAVNDASDIEAGARYF